jgi:hypothetical protein
MDERSDIVERYDITYLVDMSDMASGKYKEIIQSKNRIYDNKLQKIHTLYPSSM